MFNIFVLTESVFSESIFFTKLCPALGNVISCLSFDLDFLYKSLEPSTSQSLSCSAWRIKKGIVIWKLTKKTYLSHVLVDRICCDHFVYNSYIESRLMFNV